jgi:mannose-6-phosphate isomerase-like protein (cupin superfamily)
MPRQDEDRPFYWVRTAASVESQLGLKFPDYKARGCYFKISPEDVGPRLTSRRPSIPSFNVFKLLRGKTAAHSRLRKNCWKPAARHVCVSSHSHYIDCPRLQKRRPLMKCRVTLAAILATAALVTFGTAGGFPPRVHYVNHDKVSAAFVKGERIIEDEGLIVIANRGVQRGSEMHDTTNHVFIIMDGEAEFVTGGKMIDPKVTGPGQTRGSGIEGGVSHHLTKGDVITIPAKTPHQWKDTSKTGSVGYYAVNFENN